MSVYLGARVALVHDVEAEGVRFAFVFVILQLPLVLVVSTLWFLRIQRSQSKYFWLARRGSIR